MRVNPLSRSWVELAMLTLLSFALYQFNMFFAFLIPLRLVFLRRGAKDFLTSAATLLLAIVIFGLLRIRPADDEQDILRIIGLFWIVIAPLFIGGIYIVESDMRGVSRRLHKALIATGVAGLAGIPLVSAIGGLDAVFRANLELSETYLPGMLSFLASSVGYSSEAGSINLDALVTVVKESFLGSYLFIYFAVIAIAIAVSDWIFYKTTNEKRWTLLTYSVPSWMIWILLAPWAVIILNRVVELSIIATIALNIGTIMLLVYGLQGYAILRAILEKRNAPLALKRLVGFLVVVFILWPGLRLLIIVGLPVLGVSELWIHYRFSAEE